MPKGVYKRVRPPVRKPFSPEIRARMSLSRIKFYESNPKAREVIANFTRARIIAGWNPHEYFFTKKKKIRTMKGGLVVYQSLWEKILIFNLDFREDVVRFEKDKLRICYHLHEKKRIYIPDFLVTYTSGKKELIEIKPKVFCENEESKAKFEAAEVWCESNKVNFLVYSEDQIKEINFGHGDLKMHFDKIKVEILKDGTVKVTTDPISAANHVSADAFVQMLSQKLGGETEVERRHDHHEHGHLHQEEEQEYN